MLTNARRQQGFDRGLVLAIGLALVGGTAVPGCSSGSGGGSSATGGHAASGGASASGGATGSGGAVGSGGVTGSGGAVGSGGVLGSGGAANTGGNSGGNTGGSSASGGALGSGGTTGTGGGSAGGGASGGHAGSSAGTGGSAAGSGGAGGATNCAGHAISFNANVPAGMDPAMARVVVDFGATSTDLPLGNSDRTVEFWAYMLTSSWMANNNTTFFYGPNPSARNADGFGLDFGVSMGPIGTIDPFTNAIFDNDNQPSGVSTSPSQWVHFAMTWDGTAVRAFVNGVEKATKMSAVAQKVLMTGRSPLAIGGYPTEGAYFNGYIDEFRIWNVAHTAAEITATMHHTLVGNEPGLTGYWKFDEAPGATMAADSVTATPHTPHPGVLMANMPSNNPTFITPTPPAPLNCP